VKHREESLDGEALPIRVRLKLGLGGWRRDEWINVYIRAVKANVVTVKRATQYVLVIVVVAVVLSLFLLPVVPISVASVVTLECNNPSGPVSCTSYYPLQGGSVSASVMYAYFGLGAVQIPGSSGHSYCLMYGNPGTICGYSMHRMNG